MNPCNEMDFSFEKLLLESSEDKNKAEDTMPNNNNNF